MKRSTNRVPLIIDSRARPTPPRFERSDALLRLLLGAALEGGEQLGEQLRRWESLERATIEERTTRSAPETTTERLRYLAIGAAFRSQRRLRLRARKAAYRVEQIARPLASEAQKTWAYEVIASWLAVEVERLVAEGRLQERQARAVTRRLAGGSIDELLLFLTESDSVDQLVNSQVDQLEGNPRVTRLADSILEHFVDNPEPVRRVVQQQTGGLTGELRDEIRERAVTLDMFAENVVRRLLRRKPRAQLPLPPAQVRARAVHLHPELHD